MAVATSGAYERGDHVVDGRSDAQGPPRACRSATVVGPDLTFADAYATVVFILGIDGIEWVQRQPGSYGVYVITGEGRGVSGSSLADHVTVL
jgi:thiamine biosynthesis lipoprotein